MRTPTPPPNTVPSASRAASTTTRTLRVAGLLLLLVGLASPTLARAGALPSLPGPPPGAGQGFPAAPPPGTVPVAGPVGPAASVPTGFAGPGLRSGLIVVHGGRFNLEIACRTSGRVSLVASTLGSGTLARGGYACRDRQGTAHLSLKRSSAGRLTALKSAVAQVSLGGGSGEKFSITLMTRPTASPSWTGGGLQCSILGAYAPYLVAPNFTVTPPAIIDVRPWVAWYTADNGWRWLGTNGPGRSSWYRWSATGSGVSTWMTPTGALNPWTWAPIRVRPNQQTYMVGVFEVIYWYAQPRYVWAYAPSWPSGSAPRTYCTFP